MMHGWQSKSTDRPKGGCSCAFWIFLEWLQWSPRPQLLNVVWCGVVCSCSCSCSCSVVVVVVVAVLVV